MAANLTPEESRDVNKLVTAELRKHLPEPAPLPDACVFKSQRDEAGKIVAVSIISYGKLRRKVSPSL